MPGSVENYLGFEWQPPSVTYGFQSGGYPPFVSSNGPGVTFAGFNGGSGVYTGRAFLYMRNIATGEFALYLDLGTLTLHPTFGFAVHDISLPAGWELAEFLLVNEADHTQVFLRWIFTSIVGTGAWRVLSREGPRWVGFGLSEDPWIGSSQYDQYKSPTYDDSLWAHMDMPLSSSKIDLVQDDGTSAWSARAFARYHFTSRAGLVSVFVDTAPQTYVYLDGVELAELNTYWTSSPQTYTRAITAGDHLVAVYWASQETFTPPVGANGFVNVTVSLPVLSSIPDAAFVAEVRSEARLVPGIRVDGG